MSLFDLVLLVIISGFALFGLWFGLVHTAGSLIGTAFGVYLASRYYAPLADWIINITGWSQNYVKVIIFVLTFILLARFVGFLFWIMEKVLLIFTRLPFIHGLNKLLGMIFGVVEGAVVIGVSLFFISRFPVGLTFMSGLEHSQLAPPLVKLASIFIPLFPEAIRILRSTIDSLI